MLKAAVTRGGRAGWAWLCGLTFSLVFAMAASTESGEKFRIPEGKLPVADMIRGSWVFPQPLEWTGEQPPGDEESGVLWGALMVLRDRGAEAGLAALEEYIARAPESPWTPSLRAHLASYYRQRGRYTLALQHWEAAWEAVKEIEKGGGKVVGDQVLPEWCRLLASLGRIEKLQEIMGQVAGRTLDGGPLDQLLSRTKEAMFTMINRPGVAYRCGTYALLHVGRKLGTGDFGVPEFIAAPSPKVGFSMTQLLELSDRHGLGLVAVKRKLGEPFVVPSVVHWAQHHYAAILEREGDRYLVVDPTFEGSVWMSAEDLEAEASGSFLVPRGQAPSGWSAISADESAQTRGRGFTQYVNDNTDQPPEECDPTKCPESNPCCCKDATKGGGPKGNGPNNGGTGGGGPNGGGAGSGGGCCGGAVQTLGSKSGMPVWRVSEPFISLWLEDEPVWYQPPQGYRISAKLYYKQRRTTPPSPYLVNFSGLWESELLSWIQIPPSGTDVIIHYAGGGERTFATNQVTYDYVTGTHLRRTGVNAFEVTHNNGRKDIYSSVAGFSPLSFTYVFLTQKIDPAGNVTSFTYSTDTVGASIYYRLYTVYDASNTGFTFTYGNPGYPAQITAISAPLGGASLTYSSSGILTNITDAGGLASHFKYDSQGITNLITPYGTTTFKSVSLTSTNLSGGPPSYFEGVDRFMLVTEPDGGRQMFFFRQDSRRVRQNDSTILMPTYFPEDEVPLSAPEIAYYENDGSMHTRNTYRWERAQYAALSAGFRSSIDNLLSTNGSAILYLDNLTYNDYLKANLTHWLHQGYGISMPGTSPSMEREPGPADGVEGRKVWYAYPGQITFHEGGQIDNIGSSNSFRMPNFVGWRESTGGNTHYFYNHRESDGVTNVWGALLARREETLDSGGSVLQTRTTTYNYATNGIDLIAEVGPDGAVRNGYFYNSYHQIARHTNAVGVTAFTYDGSQRLTVITRPSGWVTTNYYSSAGFLTNEIHAGLTGGGAFDTYFFTNSYTYSGGLVKTMTDARGLIITNFYDGLQRLKGVAYPDGTSTSNLYSMAWGQTYSGGSGSSNIIEVTMTKDRQGNWTGFGYDAARRLTAITNVLGVITRNGYCDCGNLTATTNAFGTTVQVVILHNYDYQGNRTWTQLPDGTSITNDYNLSRLVTKSSIGTYSQTNIYDTWDRLVERRGPTGLLAGLGYDKYDRVTAFTNANNVVSTNAYDNADRPIAQGLTGGAPESWGYSANTVGSTSYTNQLGNQVATYAYDAMGRKTREVTVGVSTNSFVYTFASDLKKLTNGVNQTTTWSYDVYGRVTDKLDANSASMFQYTYYPTGWVSNRVDGLGNRTIYSYDALGNLTTVNYPNSPDLTLAYDALSRMTNAVVAGQSTNRFTWTANSELASEDGPWGSDTVSYQYASLLRSGLTMAQPSAPDWAQTYTPDSSRRLGTVASPAGTFTYGYRGAGNLVTNLALPNSSVITNGFDGLARLTNTVLRASGGVQTNSHSYVYDHAHRRSRQDRAGAGNSYVDYVYDNAGQLLKATGKEQGGTARLHEDLGYAYDGAGNLARRTNNAGGANQLLQTFTNNSLNQITGQSRSGKVTVAGTTTSAATSVTVNSTGATLYSDKTFALDGITPADGANTFTAVAYGSGSRTDTHAVTVYLPANPVYQHDPNGNLTSDSRRAFEYDDENQLTRVTVTNTWKSEFQYDALRRRNVRREYVWLGGAWVQNQEVRYVYDGDLVLQERWFHPQVSLVTPEQAITYTRGRDLSGSLAGAGGIGGLLARTDSFTATAGGGPTAHAYYHADANGNITALVDTQQVVVARYLYDPYGNEISRSGPLADANLYRFSSKEFHASSGLYYYGLRYYEPNLQRWLNRDPIGERGGPNLYAFVGNDSIDAIDPFGMLSSGSATLATDPTLLMTEEAAAAYRAAQAARAVAAASCAKKEPPKNLKECVDECESQYKAFKLDFKGRRECMRLCAKKFPPMHPEYNPPKNGPKKTEEGWEDQYGKNWQPATHDGTHEAHYDIQNRRGRGYRTVPLFPEK